MSEKIATREAYGKALVELGKQNGLEHPQPEETRFATNFIR